MAGVFLFLGLLFGVVSLWLGPLGLLEALIVLALVLVQARRFPERVGGYLFGMSLLPAGILAAIISRVPACTQSITTGCYSSLTVVALAVYAIGGLAGAALLGLALRRLFGTSPPSRAK